MVENRSAATYFWPIESRRVRDDAHTGIRERI